MSKEIWKDIPNYEGHYQASTWGNVRSVDRFIKHPMAKSGYQKRKGSILKSSTDKDGYLAHTLCKEGKCTRFRSHRLILLTFNKSSTDPVNHINGIKNDNRLENLEYCTTRQNETHKHTILKNKKRYGIRVLPSGKFHARIGYEGVTRYLGSYIDEEEAYSAYRNAYFEIHGEYPW